MNMDTEVSDWDSTAYLFDESNCFLAGKVVPPTPPMDPSGPLVKPPKQPPLALTCSKNKPRGFVTSIPEDRDNKPTMSQSDRSTTSTIRPSSATSKAHRHKYSNRHAIAMSLSEHNHSTRRALLELDDILTYDHQEGKFHDKIGDALAMGGSSARDRKARRTHSTCSSSARRITNTMAKQQAATMEVDGHNSGITETSEFHDETEHSSFAEQFPVVSKDTQSARKSKSSSKGKQRQPRLANKLNNNNNVVEYNPKKWGSDATDDLTERSFDLDYLNYQNQVDPLVMHTHKKSSSASKLQQSNNQGGIQRQPSAADIRHHASWLLQKYPLEPEYDDVELGRLGSGLPPPQHYLEVKKRTKSCQEEIKTQQRVRCIGFIVCVLTVAVFLLGGVIVLLVLTHRSAWKAVPTANSTGNSTDAGLSEDRTINVLSSVGGADTGDYQLDKVLVMHTEQREAVLEYDWDNHIPHNHHINYSLYDGNLCSNGATNITNSSAPYMTTTLHPDYIPNSPKTVVAVQMEFQPSAIMYTPVYKAGGMLGGIIGVCVGLTVRNTDTDEIVHHLEHFVTLGWNAQFMQITGADVTQITGPL